MNLGRQRFADAILFGSLAVLCLLLPRFGDAQTNAPRLEVSAYACRGPDRFSRTSGNVLEFRVTLAVTNKGSAEVVFQKVEAAFGSPSGGALTVADTGPANTMTVKPGGGHLFSFVTDGYTPQILADSGGRPGLQIILFDEHSNALSGFSATLPTDLPIDDSNSLHQEPAIRGAKLYLVSLFGPAVAVGNPANQNVPPAPYEQPAPPSMPIAQLRTAADAGDAGAQLELGKAYAQGRGVTQEKAEAYKWYLRSAEQGNPQGQEQVADCLSEGFGVSKDDAQAVKWYRKAAEQGHSLAQLNLGFAYELGHGVAKDPVEGAKWYRKAAEQGLPAGQSNLAYCYLNGDGLPQDSKEAVRWYRKAAEQSFAEAQASLAMCYRQGQGVALDAAEAVHWDRLAAEQGNARAQGNLGVAYLLGEGVEKDAVEAYKWFALAAAQGYERAEVERKTMIQDFGLTPADVAEGERRARAFAPKSARIEPERDVPPGPRTAGSGFFITDDGYLLTCFHVIAYAARVEVRTARGIVPATIVKTDPANDLAILKVADSSIGLPLAPSRSVKLGQPVFTIGFPNPDWQGVLPKLTRGEINSLAGMRDDPRQFQISVATQPGNSGGPLVDERGNVIGVIAMQANEAAIFRASGALPQNVNYAIKSAFALALTEALPELAAKLKPCETKIRQPEQVVEQTQSAAVQILGY